MTSAPPTTSSSAAPMVGPPRTTMRPAEAKPPARRRGRAIATYAEPTARGAAPTTLRKADRHLVRRFSFGLTPALAAEVKAAGGSRKWFEKQLLPGRVADRAGDAVNSWFPSVRRSPANIFARNNAEIEYVWEVAVDFSRWTMSRRIHSKRQVHEVMTDFWSNLLNVALFHDDAQFYRMEYDRVIRAHALGTFEKLLQATITHPAMGLYLDNAYSTKESPNENLGRELLELHTVGVDGGYTEADVKASARILTGYRVDIWWPEFRAFYDRDAHDTDPVRVMGFRHRNASADGRAATKAYLSYLARHPATARRLARRLCVKFVSDTPSASIVNAVTKAYLDSGTAIKPTLRAMVAHRDFDAAPLSKVRMPSEDYVATVRALGIRLKRPTGRPVVRQGHVLAVRRGRPAAVRVAGAQRLPGGRTAPGRVRAGCSPRFSAPRPRCPLVAHRAGGLPRPGRLAAHDAGHAAEGDRPPRPEDARPATGHGSQPRHRPAARPWTRGTAHPRRGSRVLDLPRHRLLPARLPHPHAPMRPAVTTPRSAPSTRSCGCPDFRMSRRRLLGTSMATGAAFAGAQMFGDAFRQVAYGGEVDGNVVVVLSLRGGSDGLSIIVPRGSTTTCSPATGRASPCPSRRCSAPTPGSASTRRSPRCCRCGTAAASAPSMPSAWRCPTESHFDAMEEVEGRRPRIERAGRLDQPDDRPRRGCAARGLRRPRSAACCPPR